MSKPEIKKLKWKRNKDLDEWGAEFTLGSAQKDFEESIRKALV